MTALLTSVCLLSGNIAAQKQISKTPWKTQMDRGSLGTSKEAAALTETPGETQGPPGWTRGGHWAGFRFSRVELCRRPPVFCVSPSHRGVSRLSSHHRSCRGWPARGRAHNFSLGGQADLGSNTEAVFWALSAAWLQLNKATCQHAAGGAAGGQHPSPPRPPGPAVRVSRGPEGAGGGALSTLTHAGLMPMAC